MKLLKLKQTVRVKFNPYIITSRRISCIRVGMEFFFGILLINTWVSPCSIPVKSVLSLIFIGMIYSIKKFSGLLLLEKFKAYYMSENLYLIC